MLKKLLTDRRGVAIEMAILMTVVCFAISTIVLSTSLLQHQHKVRAEEYVEENVIIEQIVAQWLKNTANDVQMQDYRGMVVWKDGQVAGLAIVQTDEEGNKTTILTVTIENGKISQWKKG